jgi:hypothetical protein
VAADKAAGAPDSAGGRGGTGESPAIVGTAGRSGGCIGAIAESRLPASVVSGPTADAAVSAGSGRLVPRGFEAVWGRSGSESSATDASRSAASASACSPAEPRRAGPPDTDALTACGPDSRYGAVRLRYDAGTGPAETAKAARDFDSGNVSLA